MLARGRFEDTGVCGPPLDVGEGAPALFASEAVEGVGICFKPVAGAADDAGVCASPVDVGGCGPTLLAHGSDEGNGT